MIILIGGTSHTGKTLLEKHQYPYLSVDHLKMGLIRESERNLSLCRQYGCEYVLIDGKYHAPARGRRR